MVHTRLQRPNVYFGMPMQTFIVNIELDCRDILRVRVAVGTAEWT